MSKPNNPTQRLRAITSSLTTSSSSTTQQSSASSRELLGHLTLDELRLPVYEAKDQDRLPRPSTLLDFREPSVAKEIAWLMRKWSLGQDVFLLSSPSPYSRRLALTFLSLLNTPFEHVSLHRDIGEAELKQSREIRKGGELVYVDSPVVRAAKEGKALILEGIERCERGILPILNNLLENREMNLEDGTHIISPSRYDLLVKSGESTTNFIPCHPDFRIVAIGSPVPPFPGLPIDPPFRSRFQARYLDPVLAGKCMAQQEIGKIGDDSTKSQVQTVNDRLAEVVLTLQVQREMRHKMASGISSSESDQLPLFPATSLAKLARFLATFPPPTDSSLVSAQDFLTLLHVLHPKLAYASKPAKRALEETLKSAGFGSWAEGLGELDSAESLLAEGIFGWELKGIHREDQSKARAIFARRGCPDVSVLVGAGPLELLPWPLQSTPDLAVTPRFTHLLASLIQLHSLNWDVSFVPSSASLQSASSSTSLVITNFASLLGYDLEVCHLYKELGGRELFMRRVVGNGGETGWQESALVKGMKEGKLVWLESVDTIGATFGSLARLVSDREGELWEGKRLVIQDGSSSSPILESIHPSFRLITSSSKSVPVTQWLTEELTSNLLSLPTTPMNLAEERSLLVATGCPTHLVDLMETFAIQYRAITSNVGSKARKLGTKSLLRMAKRLARFPHEDLRTMLERALLVQFLPITEKDQIEDLMIQVGLQVAPLQVYPPVEVAEKSLIFRSRELSGNETKYEISRGNPPDDPDNLAHVPYMDNYLDNQSQTLLLRDIAVDLELANEHILLLGNQGVGKNKIIDRLLQLLQRGREYVQLSRDSTTQSLLQAVALEGGVLKHLETPLLRAVRLGRVIVIDEVDKAQPTVVAALSALASRGELSLPGGGSVRPSAARSSQDVVVHKNFRLILLGNRPGFPFLGNPFLQVLGDNFSCYAVPNPDLDSELDVLAQLAPDLPAEQLKALVQAFQDLRVEFDKGTITYPFSLRELLALVRHMKQFDEPLESALRNIFDFDVHQPETLDALYDILRRYKLGVERVGIDAVRGEDSRGEGESKKKVEIIEFEPKGDTSLSEPKHGKEDDKEHHGGNTWAGGTGGRDTAGLGGRGGYKRLFKGHDIRQIPDSLKAQVPDEISDRAREMARKELAQKLAEVDITSSQSSTYSRYYDTVSANIQSLVSFLENLEAKEEERVWLARQTDGDLDESRITEGLTGESTVYKRRGLEKPEIGQPQLKPKRIRFVFDLSASLYRNQADGRYARSLEALVMVLEAFDRLSSAGKQKYRIDVSGHSGEEPTIPLVPDSYLVAGSNVGDRYKYLQKAALIPQYCWPGDHTIEGIEQAVDAVGSEEADDHFVIALTDANFDRYSIGPEDLRRALDRNPKVTACLIALGDGAEAEHLPRALPGKVYRVKETSDLARTIKSVLGKMVGATL